MQVEGGYQLGRSPSYCGLYLTIKVRFYRTLKRCLFHSLPYQLHYATLSDYLANETSSCGPCAFIGRRLQG
jgi:hypothetical protein